MKQLHIIRNARVFWYVPELRWNIIRSYAAWLVIFPLFMVCGIILLVGAIICFLGIAVEALGKLIMNLAEGGADCTIGRLRRVMRKAVSDAHERIPISEIQRRASLPPLD